MSRRAPLVSISRPVSRVLSARAKRPRVTAIPLRRRLPGALSNLPGRPDPDIDPEARWPRASRRPYSVLLPVGFAVPLALPQARCALTAPFHPYRPVTPLSGEMWAAVCSLWHFPWAQHPPDVIRHRMPMEPGLSSRTAFRPTSERPSSRLIDKGWGVLAPTSRPRDQPPPRLLACGCASRAAMRLLSVAIVESSTKPSTRCGRK